MKDSWVTYTGLYYSVIVFNDTGALFFIHNKKLIISNAVILITWQLLIFAFFCGTRNKLREDHRAIKCVYLNGPENYVAQPLNPVCY